MVDPADVLAVLKAELLKDKEARIDALANGSAEDYAAYKELTGTIKGIDLSISRLIDFQNRLNSD